MTKYNSEFRIKLVQEVDAGDSFKSVARKYGIAHSLLRNWHAQYSKGGISQLLSTNKRYTPEFKLFAIEYRQQNDLSYESAAAELSIPSFGTLPCWEKRYMEYGATGLANKKKGRPPNMSKEPLKSKLELTREEQLEAENSQLRMEIAYLKKLKALVEEREKSKRKTR